MKRRSRPSDVDTNRVIEPSSRGAAASSTAEARLTRGVIRCGGPSAPSASARGKRQIAPPLASSAHSPPPATAIAFSDPSRSAWGMPISSAPASSIRNSCASLSSTHSAAPSSASEIGRPVLRAAAASSAAPSLNSTLATPAALIAKTRPPASSSA